MTEPVATGWTQYETVESWYQDPLSGETKPKLSLGAWKIFPGGVRREVVGADAESLQRAIAGTETDWERSSAPVVEPVEASAADVVADHALTDDEMHALAAKVAVDASQTGAVDPRDNGRLLAAIAERLAASPSEGTTEA